MVYNRCMGCSPENFNLTSLNLFSFLRLIYNLFSKFKQNSKTVSDERKLFWRDVGFEQLVFANQKPFCVYAACRFMLSDMCGF